MNCFISFCGENVLVVKMLYVFHFCRSKSVLKTSATLKTDKAKISLSKNATSICRTDGAINYQWYVRFRLNRCANFQSFFYLMRICKILALGIIINKGALSKG